MAVSDRGFASMPKERVREIARRGGIASGIARRAKRRQQEEGNEQENNE